MHRHLAPGRLDQVGVFPVEVLLRRRARQYDKPQHVIMHDQRNDQPCTGHPLQPVGQFKAGVELRITLELVNIDEPFTHRQEGDQRMPDIDRILV